MSEQELELPKGWVQVTVNDLSLDEKHAIRMGPFGSQLKKHELVNSGIRVLWIENVVNNNFEYKIGKFITKEKFQQLSGFSVKPNDILVTMMGTIGRTCIVPNDIGIAIISSHLLKISLDQCLCHPKFLELTLRGNPSVLKQTEKKSRGVVMKGLNTKIIKNLFFSLPPLNEQKRIVSKIEELFSKIDSTKQSLEQTKLQLELYRQSLLKSVFEGKHTKEWKLCKIDDIANVKGGKRLPKGHKLTTEKTSHPYIRVLNFQNFQINQNNLQFIPNKTYEKIKNYIISSKDVYISIAGSIGKVGLIPIELDGANLTENAAKICNIEINKQFLIYLLNSPLCQHQIQKLITSTNQGKLALFRIREISISYPLSIEEQEQIVSQIEQGFSLIENTQNIVNSTLQTLQTMKMSILKQAFEGKLVPQDPNDEPAQILLEKIKSTKEAQPTKKRRAKNVK